MSCSSLAAHAQDATRPAAPTANDIEEATAAVVVDSRTLYRVRGISSYPPGTRAAAIAERITALAADSSFDPRSLRTVDAQNSADIMAGQRRIMSVLDADAALEDVDRRTLATTYVERIQEAIADYRRNRSPAAIRTAAIRATLATVIFVPALWLVLWLARRLRRLLESRYKQRVRAVAIQSFQILQAQQIWSSVQTLLGVVRALAVVVLSYLYLHFVLGLFPWTQPTAQRLLGYLIAPLTTMGRALLTHLPDLIFLALLLLIARYALRLSCLFFEAVGRGSVTLQGFDPDWAAPSYRLARLAVIVFTVIVAYPYIPGSSSQAFKGISIFLGVMFSIGSSAFLANIVAGYALIYRRAFKVGDRVQIDDVVGDVVQTRLQVTHLRSLKGEEVIVPNSLILSSKVVNYSSLAGKQGLILHTTVAIGYDVAWRKVEAMLLAAAESTPGLLREPRPFVLQKQLGEFAIAYELNAYCGDAQGMTLLYSALHRSVLDVFNERGVQIMTPAYEADPSQPKVVPKDQWFDAPAAAPHVAA